MDHMKKNASIYITAAVATIGAAAVFLEELSVILQELMTALNGG